MTALQFIAGWIVVGVLVAFAFGRFVAAGRGDL